MENYGEGPLIQIISNLYYYTVDSNWCTTWNSVLYEVFPMSFLMEQAGGQAFTGKQRVQARSFFLLA